MQKVNCSHCGINILQSTYENHEELCIPCDKKKRQEEKDEQLISTPGCPNCDGSRYTILSWRKVTENINNRFNKYLKYIFPIKKLKCGVLYKCIYCNVHWWLHVNDNFMHIISQDRISILEKWSAKRYTLSISQLKELSKIKKTHTDMYGNQAEFIIFPCSVITKSGQHYAKSIIKITKIPPLYEDPDHILFADEIKTILPSPYALPIAVRIAASNAQEIRMNFSPTFVQSLEGRQFILNGISNFFDYSEIKGEDITLVGSNHKPQEREVEIYPENESNVYYFYSDPAWYKDIFLGKLYK